MMTVACLAGALVVITSAGASSGTEQNGELVADGAWCWFQDPRAVHYVGTRDRTYIGYVNSVGDVDVVSQEAGTAALAHTTLHAGLQADDHAAPGIVVLPDGRIAVFYARHAQGSMMFRISLRTEDITAFGPETTVPSNVPGLYAATYANPIYLPAEHRLYLFFRGANRNPVMTWTRDYVHWSPAVEVAVSDDVPTPSRPYVKYATNGVDTIAISFTDGHPHEVPRNSLYEMTYKAGVLSAPDGTPVSVLDPSAVTDPTVAVPHTGSMHTDWLREGNQSGVVYDDDEGDAHAWIESMALDPSDAPVIVYSTYQDRTNAPYYYARLDANGWTTTHIADAGGTIDPVEPEYSGGADIDRNNAGTVYVSRELPVGSGTWELGRWTIQSGTVVPVTQTSIVKNVRPVVPWGPPGEIQVVWMSGTYTDYHLGKYHTQLREITTNLAPTTARISAPAAAARGTTVRVGAAAAQGYRGDAVAYVPIELLGHTAGQPDRVLQSTRTDRTGHAAFNVRATVTMRFTIHMPATATYGASTSPSAVVNVSQGSTVRLSASPTSIRRGQTVTIGMRAVDRYTGAVFAHATIQLWQSVPGHALQLVGTYVAGANGLAQTVRRPSVTVSYQARLVASATHLAATSTNVSVHVG
ncbi:MAG: hypothetical protein QOF87_2375 [Pseudonocardiales bacterium]|nr:hypothetical protein [Pseudonocardiales bacterium]